MRAVALVMFLLTTPSGQAAAETWRVIDNGLGLSPDKASKLTKEVVARPGDLEKRIELLAYLSSPNQRQHGGDDTKRGRRQQIEWLLEHHPDSDVWHWRIAAIEPSGDALSDQADYQAVKEAWLSVAAKQPTDAKILGHAGKFMLWSDRTQSRKLLLEAERLEPREQQWQLELGLLDAVTILNLDAFDAYELPIKRGWLPQATPEGTSIAASLTQSASAERVCAAALGILRYGSVFVSQDEPQSDISNLAASLVNHGMAIDRQNESCQFAANRITGWQQLRAHGELPTAKQQADGSKLLLEQDIFHAAFFTRLRRTILTLRGRVEFRVRSG